MLKKMVTVVMLLVLFLAGAQSVAFAIGPADPINIEIDGVPATCAGGCVGMSSCAAWALFCVFQAAFPPDFWLVGPFETW